MNITRRQALGAGLTAAFGMAAGNSLGAVAPKQTFDGQGDIGPQLKLSCAAYSLRDYLPRNGKGGKFCLLDWLDLAASWRLDGVELTSYYFDSEEPKYIFGLKAKAFKLGLDVSGTSVGNNFCVASSEGRAKQVEDVKRWVDHAVELGAPCLRVFAGRKAKEGDKQQDFNWVVECLKPCCDHAGSRGVFIALENHGYLTETANEVLAIVNAVNHEWLGLNLDTGNFTEEPYKSIEMAAPKAVTTHVKTEIRTADGKGSEPADYPHIVQILREANFRGYLSLEYEGKEDAMTGVPKYLERIRAAING